MLQLDRELESWFVLMSTLGGEPVHDTFQVRTILPPLHSLPPLYAKAQLDVETSRVFGLRIYTNTIKINKEDMLIPWRIKYVGWLEVAKDIEPSMKQGKSLHQKTWPLLVLSII